VYPAVHSFAGGSASGVDSARPDARTPNHADVSIDLGWDYAAHQWLVTARLLLCPRHQGSTSRWGGPAIGPGRRHRRKAGTMSRGLGWWADVLVIVGLAFIVWLATRAFAAM
jgi:hypothetical protein